MIVAMLFVAALDSALKDAGEDTGGVAPPSRRHLPARCRRYNERPTVRNALTVATKDVKDAGGDTGATAF